ncbi:MAG: MFS transporter [Chloroflexi bacterium]|nr:MFS transporter [Chloroflexota bacterium]
MVSGKLKDLSAQQRRVIRAWCMYDWANSGYATAGGAAIFPVYFVFLFKDALGESVSILGIDFTGSSTWSLAIAFATALVAISSPVLGVIADRVAIKKALLWIYTIVGASATCLMFFSAYTGQPWLWFLAMFIIANIGFAGCLVFYNTFLPHIAPRELLDDVSSRGFAYGYVGGGLLLAVHLAMILATRDTQWADLVTRIAISSIGLWWFGWALWTFKLVPEPHIPNPIHGLGPGRAMALACRELAHTFREIRGFRVIVIYLISYLLFNDGLQTVLNVAGAYGADTIGIPLVFNMATILIIQFVAAFGAMAFSWLAGRIGTKGALSVTLVGWSVAVLFGVAVAPLAPVDHKDFDYRLAYQGEEGRYLVEAAPEEEESVSDRVWREELGAAGLAVNAGGALKAGDTLSPGEAESLLATVRKSDRSLYGISVEGGELDGETGVGARHNSNLGKGRIDWWPREVRQRVWRPLGLDAPYQWLLLGVSVGLVMGGSQALARSLFAQIVPHTRSGEFFSFFGFMGRVSTVFGPLLYVVVTGVVDTRVAVLSLLVLIIAGGVMLKWVDAAAGARAADEEDARHYAEAGEAVPG